MADSHKPITGRLRLVSADLTQEAGSRIRIRVELKHGREKFAAEEAGIGLEPMQLRLAADATLAAIRMATDYHACSLVGVKRLHAFDADVVLVSLRDADNQDRRFIGAVAVHDTLAEGAARAVLDALNRWLGAPQVREPGD
jgi:hypothetical protein